MKITYQPLPRLQAEPKELLAAPDVARDISTFENTREHHQSFGLEVMAHGLGLGNPFVRPGASSQSTRGDGSTAHMLAPHYAQSGCWGTLVGRAPWQRSLALRNVERGSVSV